MKYLFEIYMNLNTKIYSLKEKYFLKNYLIHREIFSEILSQNFNFDNFEVLCKIN